MQILILGAAGMVGRKLTERLVREGRLGGEAITRLVLHDVVEPERPQAAFAVETRASDFSNPGEAEKLAHQIHGMTLVTHQTGPEGRKVSRLLIEQGLEP